MVAREVSAAQKLIAFSRFFLLACGKSIWFFLRAFSPKPVRMP